MTSSDRESDMRHNPDPEDRDQTEMEMEDEVPDVSEEPQEVVEEYANLDEALDQIGSYLDQLEEKNDSIYARLQDLLASSRQTRQEMEAERLNIEKAENTGNQDSSQQ